MVLKKVIYVNRKSKNKSGQEFTPSMFYLETESGSRVAIKPVFDEDYSVLDFLSKIETDSSVKGKQNEKVNS